MITDRALKATVRSPGKSVLFFLLLGVLTLALCLGASVWTQSRALLARCNENYTTLALLEYMGADYPDDTAEDPGMRAALEELDASALAALPEVRSFERPDRLLAYTDRYVWDSNAAPYMDSAVLILSHLFPVNGKSNTYMGTISRSLYDYYGYEGLFVLLELNPDGFLPEYDRYYVVHGEFYYGSSSYHYFRPTAFACASASDAGVDTLENWLDVTGQLDGFLAGDESAPYRAAAEMYRTLNDAYTAFATSDLDAIIQFQQGEFYITAGRSFTPEEYASGARVCVLNSAIAEACGLTVGDMLPLSLTDTGRYPLYESYWPDTGFASAEEYEIVGLTNAADGMYRCVYLPKSNALPAGAQVGYTIGTAILQNGSADAFLTDSAALLPARTRVTVYDQGYAAVAESLGNMERIASAVTLGCGAACLAALCLFGLLYVGRQRDTVLLWLALGAGRGAAVRYLLTGAGVLALAASAFGAGLAMLGGGWLADALNRTLAEVSAGAVHYSDSSQGVTVAFDGRVSVDAGLCAAVALGVLVLSLLCCALYLRRVFAQDSGRRARSKRTAKLRAPKRAARDASLLPGVAFRTAALSIRRGGARSLAAPLVAAVCAVFVCVLTAASLRCARQLETLEDGTSIQARFTSLNGRQSHDLNVSGLLVRELMETGMFEDFRCSQGWNYFYVGQSGAADGTVLDAGHLELPTTGEGMETLFNTLARAPELVATNALSCVPEFLYTGEIDIEWLDGYDERCLSAAVGAALPGEDAPAQADVMATRRENHRADWLDAPQANPTLCVVPRDFLSEHELALGDSFRLTVGTELDEYEFRIVGSFAGQASKQHIYCQRSFYLNPDWLTEDLDLQTEQGRTCRNELLDVSFGTCTFVLSRASALDEAKALLLAKGLSEPGRTRSVRASLLFSDGIYLKTKDGLERTQGYLALTRPALFTLVAALGFVISWLLVSGRRMEFAVWRSLGARRIQSALGFFLEQGLLALCGMAVGFGGWAIFAGWPDGLWTAAAVLLGCWLLGAAAAVGWLSAVDLGALLTDKE